MKQNNPWIPIADLLAGFVFIFLLMFISASLRIMILEQKEKVAEEQRKQEKAQRRAGLFDKIYQQMRGYEESGLVRLDRGKMVIELTDSSFSSGSACLNDKTLEAIHSIGNYFSSVKDHLDDLTIYIEGHTDPVPIPFLINSCGWFDNNIQLSTLRASNIKTAFLEKAGGRWERNLAVAGYGASRLRDTKQPTDAVNRRVELRFVWSEKGEDEEHNPTNTQPDPDTNKKN